MSDRKRMFAIHCGSAPMGIVCEAAEGLSQLLSEKRIYDFFCKARVRRRKTRKERFSQILSSANFNFRSNEGSFEFDNGENCSSWWAAWYRM